jgi:NADH-quinone oxidoreductase subunit G
VQGARVTDTHRALAEQLKGSSAPSGATAGSGASGGAGNGGAGSGGSGGRKAVILGALSTRNAAYCDIRALAAAIASATGASFGVLAEGANAAGAYLAGAVPHRQAGGITAAKAGLSANEMLHQKLAAYVLFGGVEPWIDALDSEVANTLAAAELVVAITPFESEKLRDIAHVMLPIGTFAETSGTYVSLEGKWQSFAGAIAPQGEARPGWKVLRVLGNVLHIPGFEYQSSEDVLKELQRLVGDSTPSSYAGSHRVTGSPPAAPLVDINMYQADALVRRAPSLQKTREGRTPAAHY